jgi:hypothetical protein
VPISGKLLAGVVQLLVPFAARIAAQDVLDLSLDMISNGLTVAALCCL